jgi:hypothetical protein
LEVLFPEKTSPQRILEVLTPEKRALIALITLIAGERSSTHAGPILPFLFLFFHG